MYNHSDTLDYAKIDLTRETWSLKPARPVGEGSDEGVGNHLDDGLGGEHDADLDVLLGQLPVPLQLGEVLPAASDRHHDPRSLRDLLGTEAVQIEIGDPRIRSSLCLRRASSSLIVVRVGPAASESSA